MNLEEALICFQASWANNTHISFAHEGEACSLQHYVRDDGCRYCRLKVGKDLYPVYLGTIYEIEHIIRRAQINQINRILSE